MSTQHPWGIAPYFIVADVVASADWYRDKLGFHYDRLWGDPPAFAMVKRRGIIIMLRQFRPAVDPNPNRLRDPHNEAWDAYIWTEDADALYAEFKAKGVTIPRDLCDQEYGMRDFDIEDCNGYRLCFGHDIEG
jgi:uncharacterized glyoxalase superfamily protein PhnB